VRESMEERGEREGLLLVGLLRWLWLQWRWRAMFSVADGVGVDTGARQTFAMVKVERRWRRGAGIGCDFSDFAAGPHRFG
jgi:hypothetical protein